MKPKKGFELRESRLVELLERGFDGKSALELRSALERVKKIVGKRAFSYSLRFHFSRLRKR